MFRQNDLGSKIIKKTSDTAFLKYQNGHKMGTFKFAVERVKLHICV